MAASATTLAPALQFLFVFWEILLSFSRWQGGWRPWEPKILGCTFKALVLNLGPPLVFVLLYVRTQGPALRVASGSCPLPRVRACLSPVSCGEAFLFRGW